MIKGIKIADENGYGYTIDIDFTPESIRNIICEGKRLLTENPDWYYLAREIKCAKAIDWNGKEVKDFSVCLEVYSDYYQIATGAYSSWQHDLDFDSIPKVYENVLWDMDVDEWVKFPI